MLRQIWLRSYSTSTVIPKASTQPTIYALSTNFAKSAIAVVRISGPQSSYIYNKLTKTKAEPKNRIASVRKLYNPNAEAFSSTQILDEALTIFFKKPNTYTGLDLLELHLHGGIAIIKSVIESIRQLHDPDSGIIIRQAENGEFSKQAFLNGKYDLTALEGISDMINAETEQQRIASLASMSGETKSIFSKWRQEILENAANLTTIIDFGEDQDIDETSTLFEEVGSKILEIEMDIQKYLKKVKSSEILLKGIQLTLLGPPNAGKSSILNILSNKEAAIVSNIAGTTRDILDIPLEIGGYKVVLGDTAGIRSLKDADQIEKEGIKRAKTKSTTADLILMVIDPTDRIDSIDIETHIKELVSSHNKNVLVVLNKQDLYEDNDKKLVSEYSSKFDIPENKFHVVSCSTGYGMDQLRENLIQEFKTITLSESSNPIILSSRVQDILEHDVLYGFKEFRYWLEQDDVVLASESLRQSIEGIGKITGEAIGVEEILGVVFSNFCIGK
ncbi:MSS1 [Candida pseudojiufengensis]|uniref:MSS1 n=1 Tax=Candida pseudojiufengensis TaxID=497109 RepID=UPI0022254A2B|nr:MSS1 [Candida pseudojiufengensis]KAI5964621.1 MSS1 [Candida pseudojiufengensis]